MTPKQAVALTAGIACAAPAAAVDFGVMETADVVRRGDFKFISFPLAVRDGPRREHDSGVNVGLGYGIGAGLDAELQVGVYDDFTFFGADLEWSYRAGTPLELSIGGGGHKIDSDFGHPWGLDLTHIASYTPAALPDLRLIGSLDASYEFTDDAYAASLFAADPEYWTVYAVPGLQYRFTQDVDVIGEVGVGLNDDSYDYLGVGISFYFGREPRPNGRYAARAEGREPNSSASSRSPSSSTK
jgi:opacity protein-like surface antigen